MAQLLGTFVDVILPVFLIAGFGYLVGRTRNIDLGSLTSVTVLVLVPAVAFDSLARATLPRPLLLRLAVHILLQVLLLGLLTLAVARLLDWRGRTRGGLLLASLLSNSGNLGLPLALFAFGAEGLAVAGGYFALSALVTPLLALGIGFGARGGAGAIVRQLARMPVSYALLAGLVVNATGVPLPVPVARVSQLLSGGGIAIMLLLLGLQLARLDPRAEARGALVAAGLRLVIAPPVAWITGVAIGLTGTSLAVAVVQASAPTAVTAALWALEFDVRPGLVSAAVVVTTVAGVVTLTILLALLRAA